MNARDKRVEKAQTRVIFTVSFFSPGVAKLPVRFDDTIDTACTDGTGIRWNPGFFDKLSDAQLVTVLVHETAHCLLGHLWRAPEGCDWDLWNQATDHAVNLMLKDFATEVMRRGLADPFPFPEPQEAFCADPRFKGWSEEKIYAELAKRPKMRQPPGGSGIGSGGSGGSQGPPGSGKGQGGGKGAQVSPSPSPGSMPSFGQFSKPKPGAASGGKLRNDWANTLIQAAKIAQGQGTLPGSLQRLVDETVHPTVPWWEILRSWLRERAAEDWTWQEPAMEYDGSDLILPSLLSDRMGAIVFATDTSGSIDQNMLARFQAEKQECLDTMRPKSVLDIYCDASIQSVLEYVPGDTISKKAPGGGGTDFRPVFEHIAGRSEPVKALVYLTDLYGTFPERDPGIPVIWVTWTKDGKAPFGEVVYGGQD